MSDKSRRLVILNGLMALILLLGAVGPTAASVSTEGAAGPRAANYLLSITPGNATKWVDASTPQKSATYGFQVKNTGDTSLPNCDLQLYPWTFPPEKWSYNFIPSAPFEVNPNDPPKTILLVLYPSADAEGKRYTFQLKGKGLGVITNSISINLDVKQYADVLIKAPPSQAANPGETLEFNFEIQNTGNGKDRFFITSVEASVSAIQPALKDNNNWTLDLATQKSVIKTVLVPLPFDLKTTEGSAGLQLSMTVRSNFNASIDDTNWTLIQVYHIYDLSMGVSPPSASLYPGELAEFSVTVLNLGNGYDNVNLNLTSNFDASGWTVNLGKSAFLLPAGRTNTTKLKITPPLNALRGTNYKFDLIARSSGPLFPETPVERIETLSITITQVRDIYAPQTIFRYPQPIGPGQVARFPFNFTNNGNGEDLVNITVIEKPLNWHATLDFFQNIRMQPYVTQEVSLTVQSSINRNESLRQSYYVKLQIVNGAKTSIINLTFEIEVGPVYDWDFVVEEPVKGMVNPYARAVQSFTCSFTNTGNIGDEIQLALSGDYASWGKLDTTALSLAYGERKTVRLAVEVPTNAELGREYGLKIVASSLNQANLVKDFSVSVVVIHLDVSVVPADSIEINTQVWKDFKTTLGTRLNITVTIRNDGSDAVRLVNVKFYDNDVLFAEKNTTTISPLKTSKFTVPWDATLLGVHVLRVKVDANGQLGESNENNNEGVSTVMVKKVPPPTVDNMGAGWAYPLVVVVLLVVAIAVAYVLYQRRPKYDKELYESIYGRRAGGDAETQLAADRAEVERRAREKGEEGYVPSPLYESTTHEEAYPQPGAESGSAPVTGPAMEMGVSLDKLTGSQASAPPEMPTPPSTPDAPDEPTVLKPAAKKKITIRPK
jgi:uncharacterized membrane protein